MVARTAALFAWFAVMLASCVFVLAGAVACTPAERQQIETAVKKEVVPVERGTCVLIRLLEPGSSAAKEVCATADELAPLVSDLIAARDGGPPEGAVATQAAALEVRPTKRHHHHHCRPYDGGADEDAGASSADGGRDGGPDGS